MALWCATVWLPYIHMFLLYLIFFFFSGHLMDNWELPGTAHFCEHMLFLGTDKVIIRAESRVVNFLCSDLHRNIRNPNWPNLLFDWAIFYSVFCLMFSPSPSSRSVSVGERVLQVYLVEWRIHERLHIDRQHQLPLWRETVRIAGLYFCDFFGLDKQM